MSQPQKHVAAITALAIAISEGKSNKELVYIAEILGQLSHTIRTIATLEVELEALTIIDDILDDEEEK